MMPSASMMTLPVISSNKITVVNPLTALPLSLLYKV